MVLATVYVKEKRELLFFLPKAQLVKRRKGSSTLSSRRLELAMNIFQCFSPYGSRKLSFDDDADFIKLEAINYHFYQLRKKDPCLSGM